MFPLDVWAWSAWRVRVQVGCQRRLSPLELPLHVGAPRPFCVGLEPIGIQAPVGSGAALQRIALELAYFGGLTHLEIAMLQNQPLGTVKTRIRLGMKKLKVALQQNKVTREQL